MFIENDKMANTWEWKQSDKCYVIQCQSELSSAQLIRVLTISREMIKTRDNRTQKTKNKRNLFEKRKVKFVTTNHNV